MRRRLHQRTGSLLALFAMLLITFAPAISQLLAAHARTADFTAELCSAHATPADEHRNSDAPAHLGGQACGYCHVFAHAPVLPAVRLAFALDIPARQSVAPTPARDTRRVTHFSPAQPRAPPVLI
ncbi:MULTISPECIES: DUF2946 domain-containing protein [unclassified Caballeronia]|uniref:DUF2946 domain-containing protein n=1 Tax=unclassified Caballeronia TaxID=2646786 RepID=UPI0028598F2F|nr:MULTISPECIES: DUF2946 domain-containing protein [unclassified Caballeronia]MDR5824536.1 DUF2946 domain-containing protein [Caballeronia sp. LZ043]MDR5882429.1 DUF2946 domain-containing protein [Caballeronia sp. LZ032]